MPNATVASVIDQRRSSRIVADRRRSAVGWLLLTLTLTLVTWPATSARAQRKVGAPIYRENLDSAIEGATEALDQLERAGWLLRGQSTVTVQGKPRIRSRYQGVNSLGSGPAWESTQSTDLVLGRRLWAGAEIIAVPSWTRGRGLSDAKGLAAGASQEAFHGGTAHPILSLSRLFVRQTIGLSYDASGNDDDPTRFAGPLALQRITLTAGKVAAWDFFDNNRFAHDPRAQFLNWALVGTGAFDIAGDAAGFTHGAVAEWEDGHWAARVGGFQVARHRNSDFLDERVGRAWQGLLEVDRFWWLGRHPGALRLLGGASRTRSARYDALTRALVEFPAAESAMAQERLRAPRTKPLLALNWEQQWNDTLGSFARLGWNDGRAQAWMFTEMDWSASAGLAINGWRWERFADTVGLAFNMAGLHAPQRRFYAAGGTGFVLGDGRLRYAPETAFEAYYDAELRPGLNAALDLQLIVHPGHNADRGPVPVAALRLRAAF